MVGGERGFRVSLSQVGNNDGAVWLGLVQNSEMAFMNW